MYSPLNRFVRLLAKLDIELEPGLLVDEDFLSSITFWLSTNLTESRLSSGDPFRIVNVTVITPEEYATDHNLIQGETE